MTSFAALQTATINTSAYLGINNLTGIIEAGKEADLLLLDKNPLDDIKNTRTISGVFAEGNWYDKKAIEKILDEAKPGD